MSMDDILKLLVDSRQQGQSPSQGSSDSMTELIGGLLGGGQASSGSGNQQSEATTEMTGSLLGGSGGQSSQAGGGQQSGLSGMMSLLEMATGAGGQSALGSNPMAGMIQPLVKPLAERLNIPPETATVVVSFVLQKLLAHHPTSGRDSTQFNIDDLFSQLGSGKLDPAMLRNSGMADELARATGMDKAQARKSLHTAFSMVGKRALRASNTPGGRTLKGAVSSGEQIAR